MPTLVCGHGAAVGIAQRDLAFPRPLQSLAQRLVLAALLAERLDLLRKVLYARAALACLLDISGVQPAQIILKLLVGRRDELFQRSLGEVAILVVDGLDARSIHSEEFAAEQIEPPAKDNEGAKNQPKSGAIAAAEISDCFEIRLQAAQQPDQLDVAMAFGFQPPARPDPVQIAVDIKL
jgi:hypothetical protein